MNSSCFLAPIHEPKFENGYNLVKSYNNFFDDDHIYLIFSSEKEEKKFKEKYKKIKFRSLVCLEPTTSGVVTLKKYDGLKKIFSDTEFENVGVIDVDTVFIKKTNYDELFQEYINNKLVYSNLVNEKNFNSYNPLRFFNESDLKKVKEILSVGLLETYNVYFWFNDIPIYNKKFFIEMLEYINYEEIKTKINHMDFDYILYNFFLLSKNYFKIKLLSYDNDLVYCGREGFIEEQEKININKFSNIYNSYNPMWIKKEIPNMKNTFMKVHTDR
jgi:hypothetical protein